MKLKKWLGFIFIFVLLLISFSIYYFTNQQLTPNKNIINQLPAIIIALTDTNVTLMDQNDIIYSFDNHVIDGSLGDSVLIEYHDSLDYSNITSINIINSQISSSSNQTEIPDIFNDNGIFRDYYHLAYQKLTELTLDEKIGQLILARYPDKNIISDLKQYKLGGYVFFEKDFKNKSKDQVISMITNVQNNSSIPLITSVDEEGGKIVRISSNSNLASSRFKSSRELYTSGGMTEIYQDTINKSLTLSELGINVNLAPVIDVSTNKNDYMYSRSIGETTAITSVYAQTVIKASQGLGVSYTLKHFPGYGNNADTHKTSNIDNRSYESILANDIPPFQAGITVGAEAIMISHNTVSSIDATNPASLSPQIHNLLRHDLGFTGVIITDDLYMGATSSIENNAVKALLSGNNLLITTDYVDSITSIKIALNNGTISEKLIDKLAFRVLAWKYYKGLLNSDN